MPSVAFGLLAMSVMGKAKLGALRQADKLAFAVAALEWCDELPVLRTASLDFLSFVDRHPRAACDRLYRVILRILPEPLPDPVPVLERLHDEARAEGWHTRKDCGHD